jgi:hypothetical protein
MDRGHICHDGEEKAAKGLEGAGIRVPVIVRRDRMHEGSSARPATLDTVANRAPLLQIVCELRREGLGENFPCQNLVLVRR